jgi:hypothetical protein
VTTKTGCPKCGHDAELVAGFTVQPHHLGCPRKAGAKVQAPGGGYQEPLCEFGGCQNFKRPQGKGPKPKFCTEHSDPKNRK